MEVKVQKVNFAYSRQIGPVLNDINLKISEHKITGIIGNNASGKSTLLKLISGKLLPNKGKIILGNDIISRKCSVEEIKRINQIVGYLPQILDDNLSSNTIRDELMSYLENLNMDLNEIDNRIAEIFPILGLEPSCLDNYADLFSEGERRRIAIGCILIYNPRVIVLDEPTVGLDSTSKKSLINYLTKIKKLQEKTIIIASNDVDFINKIADNIVVLEDGKVIKSDNKSEIFRDVNFFDSHDIAIPRIIDFEDTVLKEKGIRLGYRDDINDLVKDILRKS